MEEKRKGCSTKRGPTAAAGCGIGIAVFKTTFFEGINVIDFDFFEKGRTLTIDEDFKIALLNHHIILIGGFLKAQIVGESRTSTRDHADPQPVAFFPFFGHHGFDFGQGRFGQGDEFSIG